VNGLYRAFASVVFGWTLLCQAVYAGRSCAEPQPLKTETVVRALNLAVQTVKLLDSSGAQVVVLGRAGQDLTKYGLHYSHGVSCTNSINVGVQIRRSTVKDWVNFFWTTCGDLKLHG